MSSKEQIIQAVLAFINAETWDESKRIVENHPILLTNEAEQFFDVLLAQSQDDEETTQIIKQRRDLLARCRQEGVDTVFAELIINTLINEINSLTRPNDIPRRIQACQELLSLVDRTAQPESWAAWQVGLANSISQNPLGNRANNLEQAISHYQQALQIFTRQSYPEQWAIIQNYLANTYLERTQGSYTENLDLAISHGMQALQIFTRQSYPEQWAQVHYNLAKAYAQRRLGSWPENLEQAISHYQQGFQVFTRQSYPIQLAHYQSNSKESLKIKLNLFAYYGLEAIDATSSWHSESLWESQSLLNLAQQRTQAQYKLANLGFLAHNLEKGISHYKVALEVYTRQAFPRQWARLQNSLGEAYRKRIRGKQADNLEQAIAYYKRALGVYTREELPQELARTLSNLATAYRKRIRGARADNLEQAIRYYYQALDVNYGTHEDFSQGALTIYPRADLPQESASTLANLATAYRERIYGKPADNLKQATRYYQQALEIYTREVAPFQWAEVQHNLANLYRQYQRGYYRKNLRRAIYHYQQALEVYTRQAAPFQWATIHYDLAIAYTNPLFNSLGSSLRFNSWDTRHPQEWKQSAISHYERALEIFTPEAFPHNCRQTAYRLGCLLYDEGHFEEARQAFEMGHQAVEALLTEVRRPDVAKGLAEENADMYARLVDCCLQMLDEEAAFEYAIIGNGRAFVDSLISEGVDIFAILDSNPALANDSDVVAYRQLVERIADLRATLSNQSEAELRELNDQLQAKLSEQTTLWDQLVQKYPTFTATLQPPRLTMGEAQTLADELSW